MLSPLLRPPLQRNKANFIFFVCVLFIEAKQILFFISPQTLLNHRTYNPFIFNRLQKKNKQKRKPLKNSLSDLSLQNKGSKFGEPTPMHYLCIEQGDKSLPNLIGRKENAPHALVSQRSGTPPSLRCRMTSANR